MKKSKFAITDTDYKLLQELWRWKILSTSIIHHTIFEKRTLSACYKRLNRLEKSRYIESFCSRDAKRWFWQLTDKGFKILNFDELKIAQTGFKSEHRDHDLLVTLFHLGLWQSFKNTNGAIYTEQELRRIDVKSYPSWVPQTTQHRSDGYYKMDLGASNDKSLVSIEVELNLKSAPTYAELGLFYSDVLGIHQVIWLVKSETDAKFIQRNLAKDSSRKGIEHSFIILGQWFQHLWQTKVFIGKDQGKSIENIFVTTPSPSRGQIPEMVHFDFRKKLINSSIHKSQVESVIAHNKIIGY
jgi:hypothetical protein